MKNPNPVNLQTSQELRAQGWQAESRDADGHLTSWHAPIDADDRGIAEWIMECTSSGETVTFWPASGPLPPAKELAKGDECFTVVFSGNLRKLKGNPHHFNTQFGPVLSIGVGNAFEEATPSSVPIVFGLEAQGHIPTIEAMLNDGEEWPEIGRRIGWDWKTAKAYYQRFLSNSPTSDVPASDTAPISPSSETAGTVEVCPECDIAGYKHLRRRGEPVQRRAGKWLPPEEANRPEGYECLVTIPVRWERCFSGHGFVWASVNPELVIEAKAVAWAPSPETLPPVDQMAGTHCLDRGQNNHIRQTRSFRRIRSASSATSSLTWSRVGDLTICSRSLRSSPAVAGGSLSMTKRSAKRWWIASFPCSTRRNAGIAAAPVATNRSAIGFATGQLPSAIQAARPSSSGVMAGKSAAPSFSTASRSYLFTGNRILSPLRLSSSDINFQSVERRSASALRGNHNSRLFDHPFVSHQVQGASCRWQAFASFRTTNVLPPAQSLAAHMLLDRRGVKFFFERVFPFLHRIIKVRRRPFWRVLYTPCQMDLSKHIVGDLEEVIAPARAFCNCLGIRPVENVLFRHLSVELCLSFSSLIAVQDSPLRRVRKFRLGHELAHCPFLGCRFLPRNGGAGYPPSPSQREAGTNA